MFRIVFCVRKAVLIFVCWKSFVILLASLALYVKIAHYVNKYEYFKRIVHIIVLNFKQPSNDTVSMYR
jgi:hypothetical protein